MVSVGISKLGCTELVFVVPGVKINGAYYHDVLLSKQLGYCTTRDVRGIRRIFVFQQDNSQHTGTRHCATSRATPAFHQIFGANSPDLNPFDYRIWSIVQQLVYQSRVHETEELKQCVQECGVTSTRASLTMQMTSGTSVFVHVCRRTADTSSICCRKQ